MSSTGQTTPSAHNVKLIIDALADYAKETGIDLTKNPFASKLEQSRSPEDILQLLGEREKAFKEYRDGKRRLINCLNPAVTVLHKFSGVLSGAAGQVSRKCHLVRLLTRPRQIPFPPASALFVGLDTLLGVRSLGFFFRSSPVIYELSRPLAMSHQAMTLSPISLNIWGVSLSAWASIPTSHLLR
jgi:hypothetical protein